jgi:hypothetical protein
MQQEQTKKKKEKKRKNVIILVIILFILLLLFIGLYLYLTLEKPPVEFPEPDFIIDSVSVSPAIPDTTDTVTITATVKNTGPGFGRHSKVSVAIGDEASPQKYFIPALIPDDSFSISRKALLPDARQYRAEAVADADSAVFELDETNNRYIVAFFVKLPFVPSEKVPEPVIIKDTTPVDTIPPDTVAPKPPDPCEKDTIAPWVYPEPSGGRHYSKASVHFIASEPCEIEWKFKDEDTWNLYKDQAICITKNAILCYRAKDSCDNTMDPRCEKYEIEVPVISTFCLKDMEYIKIGNTEFCIDRYEWPNKRGLRPMSHISIYHAMDSCFTAGKRLCTTDEWSLACAGAYSWKYPYGDSYEPNACVTRDTSVQVSGDKPECRGYFGIFDMSGNLAEWTNTKSSKNPEFFNVMGGFWESGPQSSCFQPRYSYYPRNRHNPVGFRCCKEVNKK